MRVRFLLGPAGSGKTSQCLDEVRTALLASPEGPPLIFLAPKQATFQIERQLLADARLKGFTRLFIFSFERLADFVLDAVGAAAPRLLNEDGRVMILRSLVAEATRENKLRLFHASARLPGFAQELSKVVRECQRAGAGPERLRKVAEPFAPGQPRENAALADKLADLALLFEGYDQRLAREKLEDADRLLDAATAALRPSGAGMENSGAGAGLLCEALWMDGFAEMTVQELELLAAVLPWCGRATLAFCCDGAAMEGTASKRGTRAFSPWSVVADTASRCRIKASAIAEVETVMLERISAARGRRDQRQLDLFEIAPACEEPEHGPATHRFTSNADLAHLERHWSAPVGRSGTPQSVRVISCSNAEAEVTFAAREIRRHVDGGGRYRDVAVLVREMRGYQEVVRRVFERYEIPHFLDRRESVSHHPLAELTRYALRTISGDWRHEDWFGLLKTGLCCSLEDADWLENAALERGWKSDRWLTPLVVTGDMALERRLEAVRQRTVAPLLELHTVVSSAPGSAPTGAELANGLRALWSAFGVESQLAEWTAEAPAKAVHSTVWEQMDEWLDTLSMAFAHERVRLAEWLQIIEAGLASLTVGVIPPVLDEVLVGSVDRSRNPELKLAFVLGVNEGVFPAIPAAPPLLNEADRLELEGMLGLGTPRRAQLAHERFYAYIAFTRAAERLFVLYAEADRAGKKQNPSSLISHLKRLFPDLPIEKSDCTKDVVHASELAVQLIRAAWKSGGRASPRDPNTIPGGRASSRATPPLQRYTHLPPPYTPDKPALDAALVEKLYPQRLVTSVSRLEEFAACAFRFFVTVGLRAKERQRFEVDARRTGTFQHEVLMAFHETVRSEGRRWRDLSPAEARRMVGKIADAMLMTFHEGLLVATPRDRVESNHLKAALQDFIETAVGWAKQYAFDPVAVELDFKDEGRLPAWELTLRCGRTLAFTGTVDRVDALIDRERRHADIVVMDYKSSAREVDSKLLDAGVQLQLFAYLAALCRLPEAAQFLGVETVAPAGGFYVTLRSRPGGADSRDAALADADEARRKAYQHRGRFKREMIERFDDRAGPGASGDQFLFKQRKTGEFYATNRDPISAEDFERLLAGVERQLVEMGDRVFAGKITLNPYRHRNKTPCERCEYEAVCRIDRWTHEFRSL